jgi:hypothetical protein
MRPATPNPPDDPADAKLTPEQQRVALLLRLELWFDEWRAIAAGLNAWRGKGTVLQAILARAQLEGMRTLKAKAERGVPVSDVELFGISLVDGRLRWDELTLLSLMRGAAARPVPRGPSAQTRGATTQTSGQPSTDDAGTTGIRPLADWLSEPTDRLLQRFRSDASLAYRATAAPTDYEAIAVAWARTIVGEGLLNPAVLPPAIGAWVVEDAYARAHPTTVTAHVFRRAQLIDEISAGSPRATRYALPPLWSPPTATERGPAAPEPPPAEPPRVRRVRPADRPSEATTNENQGRDTRQSRPFKPRNDE